ncbi:MAG: hypothetical protein KC438_12635 [Thermomicrobiales bacterium]|nr:hypothetical protein [Thermomicrobiales bacterium]
MDRPLQLPAPFRRKLLADPLTLNHHLRHAGGEFGLDDLRRFAVPLGQLVHAVDVDADFHR